MSLLFPAQRDPEPKLESLLHEHAATGAIHRGWQRSRKAFDDLARVLKDFEFADEILCVAASGSLGRMELQAGSDLDLLVVVTDRCAERPERSAAVFDAIWRSVALLGFSPPDPAGIYAAPTGPGPLVDPTTVGAMNEEPFAFGRRIQLLLDSQPILGHTAFHELLARILERCTPTIQIFGEASELTPTGYLQAELERYLQALSAYRYRPENGNDSQGHAGLAGRRLNDIKFCFSRRLMVAGLRESIRFAQSQVGQGSAPDWITRWMDLIWRTPLERVCHVAVHGGLVPEAIVRPYEYFLASMEDREKLLARLSLPDWLAQPAIHQLAKQAREFTDALERVRIALV